MHEITLENAEKIIKNHYKDYDFKRFLPFYHGTSSYSAKKILKDGLCPRKYTQMSSVWEDPYFSKMESNTDRVYFAGCREKDIPQKSAHRAKRASEYQILNDIMSYLRKKNIEYMDEKYQELLKIDPYIQFLASESKIEQTPVYLKLKNFEKYQNDLIRDEDEAFDGFYLAKSQYMDQLNKYAFPFCSRNIEKKIIDIFDIMWAECGESCIKELAKYIPSTVKSLYTGSNSVAITRCVDPEDLEVLSEHDFFNEEKLCVNVDPPNGGCIGDEYRLKEQYIENELHPQSYPDAKQKLIDYIKKEKYPKFDIYFEDFEPKS